MFYRKLTGIISILVILMLNVIALTNHTKHEKPILVSTQSILSDDELLKELITNYVSLAKKNDIEALKGLLVETPNEYLELRIQKANKENQSNENFNSKDSTSPNSIKIHPSVLNEFYYNDVLKEVPKTISDNFWLEGINKIRIKGKLAVVRAKFVSNHVPTYNFEQDFFVYKVDKEWKIFKVAENTGADW